MNLPAALYNIYIIIPEAKVEESAMMLNGESRVPWLKVAAIHFPASRSMYSGKDSRGRAKSRGMTAKPYRRNGSGWTTMFSATEKKSDREVR